MRLRVRVTWTEVGSNGCMTTAIGSTPDGDHAGYGADIYGRGYWTVEYADGSRGYYLNDDIEVEYVR